MFWHLSLRELWGELSAAKRRQQHADRRDLRNAWSVEALRRTKRLPKLADLLRERGSRQTFEEQVRIIQGLSRMYGGRVTAVEPNRVQ